MRQALVIFAVLSLVAFVLQCDEKKPDETNFEDPDRFFPVNFKYEWTYVDLGPGCVVAERDTWVVAARTRTTRTVEGVSHNGWDLQLLTGGQSTGFRYRVKDTIFYWNDVSYPEQPPYKVLVGPVKAGTNWKDRDVYGHEYFIVGIEDYYSAVMNYTFNRCARVKRTTSGDNRVWYYWWAPGWGKVGQAQYQAEQCLDGAELKRLYRDPDYP